MSQTGMRSRMQRLLVWPQAFYVLVGLLRAETMVSFNGSCCIGTMTQSNRQLMVFWLIDEH